MFLKSTKCCNRSLSLPCLQSMYFYFIHLSSCISCVLTICNLGLCGRRTREVSSANQHLTEMVARVALRHTC